MTPIIYKNQKVITTELLAQAYETDVKNIQMNFSNQQRHFYKGTHYFKLNGEELRNFKNQPNNIGLVARNASSLYLWTERGANRHSKILDTDKAWEQFENLEETYFRVKGAGAYQIGTFIMDGIGAVASLLREERLALTAQKSSGYKIARQAELTLKTFGLPVLPDFVEPSYEQVTLTLPTAKMQLNIFSDNAQSRS